MLYVSSFLLPFAEESYSKGQYSIPLYSNLSFSTLNNGYDEKMTSLYALLVCLHPTASGTSSVYVCSRAHSIRAVTNLATYLLMFTDLSDGFAGSNYRTTKTTRHARKMDPSCVTSHEPHMHTNYSCQAVPRSYSQIVGWE